MSLPLLFSERKSHDFSSSLTKILKIASPKKYSVSISKQCQKDIDDILRKTKTLINVGNDTTIKIPKLTRSNSQFKLSSNKSLVKMVQIPKKVKKDYLLEKIKKISIRKLSKRNSSESSQSSSTKSEKSKEKSLLKKTRSLSQTNITYRNKECNKLFNILFIFNNLKII